MTKGTNTSNLATDMKTGSKGLKSCRLEIDNINIQASFFVTSKLFSPTELHEAVRSTV